MTTPATTTTKTAIESADGPFMRLNAITIEPDWPSMFGVAARIAATEIAPDRGRDFVRELLEYGGRLSANAAAQTD